MMPYPRKFIPQGEIGAVKLNVIAKAPGHFASALNLSHAAEPWRLLERSLKATRMCRRKRKIQEQEHNQKSF